MFLAFAAIPLHAETAAEAARWAMLEKRGDPRAVARAPTPPDYPHEVHYLREWVNEVHGHSGYRPDGKLMPVTHTTLRDWARNTRRRPLPHEIDALIELDTVLCLPPTELVDG